MKDNLAPTTKVISQGRKNIREGQGPLFTCGTMQRGEAEYLLGAAFAANTTPSLAGFEFDELLTVSSPWRT